MLVADALSEKISTIAEPKLGGVKAGGVSYDSSYGIMKRLYNQAGIVATKCLHQGRGEDQRALEERHAVALQEVELEGHVLADDVAVIDEEEDLMPQRRAVCRLQVLVELP